MSNPNQKLRDASPSRWSDHRVEQALGRLLQVGVLIAAVVVFAGAVMYLMTHAHDAIDYRVFHSASADTRSIHAIFSGAFQLRARSLTQCGLLLLIALPIARVAFSLVAFALQRDRLYILLTTLVLLILLYGLTGRAA